VNRVVLVDSPGRPAYRARVTRAAARYDVVVIGAGPAGSTAAQLLAQWGWTVALVHREATRPSLAESLPSSARKLFAFLGQLPRVEAARFHPNHGNVARWAGAPRSTRTPDAGFHVSRAAFDCTLRDGARAAGAVLVEGAVRRVDCGDPVGVSYWSQSALCRIDARMVLDCSGRAGIVARRGWRREQAAYRTLAIAAEYDCPGWPVEERTETLVESYGDGWSWSVPLSVTRRQCTVMVDRTARTAGEPLAARYARELARTTALGARLASARPIGAPWACDASIYDCTRAADEGVLLVGDAASFIEPLSSAGVKKALLSAWRAAVVANTCLKDTARAGIARDLYERRERQVYADCSRRARAFFSEAAPVYRTAFWTARAATSAGDEPFEPGGEWTDDALAHDVGVRRAFEFLRASDRVRLRAASTLRVEPIGAIDGREVVLRDALVVAGAGAPLQFAAGVDLPALARLASGGGDVPSLIAAYQQHVGAVPLTGLLAGLSLLVARHALVPEVSAS
jgi:flavin-dependent dehydrogenase